MSNHIDFYIDSENQAIPSSIAFFLDNGDDFSESVLGEVGVLPISELQSAKRGMSWLWLVMLLTSAFSLSVLWLNGVAQTVPSPVAESLPSVQPIQLNQQAVAKRLAAPSIASAQIDRTAEATTIADRALTLAKSARSVDDWSLVANQWQKAIGLFKTVPHTSANYSSAQKQIQQIQQQLTIAQQKASHPIVEAPMATTTVFFSTGVTCSQTAAPAATPMMLSKVQFQSIHPGDKTAHIVGCITNNSNQPITNVSLAYKGSSAKQSDIFQAGNTIITPMAIEPGRTVAFRSSVTVDALVTNVNIQTVSWIAPGSKAADIATTSVQIAR